MIQIFILSNFHSPQQIWGLCVSNFCAWLCVRVQFVASTVILYLLKETLWVITGAAALQSIILFDRKIAEIFIQVYEDIRLFQEMAAAIT